MAGHPSSGGASLGRPARGAFIVAEVELWVPATATTGGLLIVGRAIFFMVLLWVLVKSRVLGEQGFEDLGIVVNGVQRWDELCLSGVVWGKLIVLL